MGVSPGYMMMVGASEILAGLLLFFRRTFVFGSLLMLGILINVVAMNWFYNVPVKMFSFQLLLYNIFIIAPYAAKLFHLFFTGTPVVIAPEYYAFDSRVKKYSVKALIIFIPLTILFLIMFGTIKRYLRQELEAKNEKIYDVTDFVAKDTIPTLTPDTVRWSRLILFVQGNYAVVCNMKNKQYWYQCNIDSVKKTFTFNDINDKKKSGTFNYFYLPDNRLKLTGNWKGNNMNVVMVQSDSIPLRHEKIKLITD